jgi:hypothetical protein
MAGELDSLIIRLAAETADAQRSMKRMEGTVTRFEKTTEKSLGKVDQAFMSTSKVLANFGIGMAGAFSVKVIANFVDGMVRATNSMADTADTVGLTTQKFQKMRALFADQGMGVEKLEGAMGKFAVAMGEVRSASGGFYELLAQHSPELARNLQATHDQAEALSVMENALERIDDPATRNLLTTRAFGRANAQLGVILGQTGDQMQRGAEVAKEWGTVISADAIKHTREMQREIDLLGQSFAKLSVDYIGGAIKEVKKFASEWHKYLDFITNPLGASGKTVGIAGVFELKGKEPEIAANVNQLTSFATKEMAATIKKQPPLEWAVKLRPDQQASGWKTKTTKAEADPNDAIIEKARQNHERFVNDVANSYRGLEYIIEDALTQPLDDAFSGNIQSAKTYFREVLQGMTQLITKTLVLKPLMEGITSGLSGGGQNSFSNLLGSLGGSLFGGFRAAGGPVSPGKAYMVGENGPEMVVPRMSGQVVPNGGGTGGGGTVYNIDARGAAAGVEQRIYEALAEMERKRPAATTQMARYQNRYPLRAS